MLQMKKNQFKTNTIRYVIADCFFFAYNSIHTFTINSGICS